VASADLIIRSFNFAEIEELQSRGAWHEAGNVLATAARDLEAVGCEAIVLCTNTMHVVADAIESAVTIPLLHIADATADAIREAGASGVALLGTRYTMEQDFYAGRLRDRHGLDVLIPEEPDRTMIHDVIYDELVQGIVSDESRENYRAAIDRLVAKGAEGVIAGCTEIELLIGQGDVEVPLFPTARLHADAAARFALGR
jgi:aspartate racemase